VPRNRSCRNKRIDLLIADHLITGRRDPAEADARRTCETIPANHNPIFAGDYGALYKLIPTATLAYKESVPGCHQNAWLPIRFAGLYPQIVCYTRRCICCDNGTPSDHAHGCC
jgi:hypothetical protein